MNISVKSDKFSLYRRIWHLSLPMIWSNITVPLLGMVDIAVIGHLNQVIFIDSVNLGACIISYIYWLLVLLRWSSSGLTAQAYGQKDEKAIDTILVRGMILALLVGAIIILSQNFIIDSAIDFMHPDTSLIPYTTQFLKICLWGAPAAMLNYVLVGWFIGIQNTKAPMCMLIGSNFVGMLLDIIFVFYFHIAVAGVALATLIAQYSAIMIGLLILYKKRPFRNLSLKAILQWEEVKKLLFINQNIFLRSLCLCFAYAFFTRQSAQYGTVLYAVNAILMSFQFLLACFLDGIANATEALIGEAIGEQSREKFIAAVRAVLYTALQMASLYSLAFALFHSVIIHLMTNVHEVQVAAKDYVLWLIASPFISVWSFILDGVFVGATRAEDMRNTMFFSVVCVFLPLWYATQPFGNHGLWIAFFGFLAARALSMAIILWRNRDNFIG